MRNKTFLFLFIFLAAGTWSCAYAERPNVIFVVADDLGYNEIGAYGQDKIKTPHIDKIAKNGMKFSQFYAGAPVCATSRSVLMTGQHSGHTRVLGNAFPEDNGKQELYEQDYTLAELFKDSGYATAAIGKWGLGMPNTQGHPNKQGFDYFFGYLSQHHAHNFYPTFLWRNEIQVGLPNEVKPMGNGHMYGAGFATKAKVYAPDLFVDEALQFIDHNKNKPFFLYYATNVPHSNNEATLINRADGAEVPNLGIYAEKPWMLGAKRHAAMITRMDNDIGKLMHRLQMHGIADNTIVIFTSDNGPHIDHAEPMDFFKPSQPLSGWKMELWEGGIRVPFVVSWPKVIKANQTRSEVAYFGDFMATFADILQVKPPKNIDSHSLLPIFSGNAQQFKAHDYLYWEFRGRDTGLVALKDGRWKGIIRKKNGKKMELYDLQSDIGEQKDLSEDYPKIVAELTQYLKNARTPSENWPAIINL